MFTFLDSKLEDASFCTDDSKHFLTSDFSNEILNRYGCSQKVWTVLQI
jgi:hypothetical protein